MLPGKFGQSTALFLNAAQFFLIIGLISYAIFDQLAFTDLPCPLCLLQRVGFLLIAFGLLLNVRFGFLVGHYSIILISALYTSFVALRQIALHVIPGTGSYGNPFLGYHLYTWSFVVSMSLIITNCFLLGIQSQYQSKDFLYKWRNLSNLMFALAVVVVLGNIILTIFECQFSTCPDNLTAYELIAKN